MGGVLLGSVLLALTVERCFAEAVVAGDFDRAEQQAAVLLERPPGTATRSPQLQPTREGEPQGGSTLLLPPLSNPPLRNRRCVHGTAGGCRACRAFGRVWDVG